MFRKATQADLAAVCHLYSRSHDMEEAGVYHSCWQREIYPTPDTARKALADGSLYVLEEDGRIVATARIDQDQEEAYALGDWSEAVPPEQVLVLHTLTVLPEASGRGCAKTCMEAYAALARERGCTWLRIDTEARNFPARNLYRKLGYREVGQVPCQFNGLTDTHLVLLEKAV